MTFHLSDKQWQLVAPLVSRPQRLETRGRKRQSDRQLLDGVLLLLEKGVTLRRLTREGYPPFQSCHRRLHEWAASGALDKVIEALAKDLETRGRVPLRRCFMDSMFQPGYEKIVIMIRHDEFEDERPWQVRTRYFFSCSRIWKLFFLRTQSSWILERLPADLAKRAQMI